MNAPISTPSTTSSSPSSSSPQQSSNGSDTNGAASKLSTSNLSKSDGGHTEAPKPERDWKKYLTDDGHVRLNVEGKEILMPVEQAIPSLQKKGAGDEGLKQLAEERKRFQAEQAQEKARFSEFFQRFTQNPIAMMKHFGPEVVQRAVYELGRSQDPEVRQWAGKALETIQQEDAMSPDERYKRDREELQRQADQERKQFYEMQVQRIAQQEQVAVGKGFKKVFAQYGKNVEDPRDCMYSATMRYQQHVAGGEPHGEETAARAMFEAISNTFVTGWRFWEMLPEEEQVKHLLEQGYDKKLEAAKAKLVQNELSAARPPVGNAPPPRPSKESRAWISEDEFRARKEARRMKSG